MAGRTPRRRSATDVAVTPALCAALDAGRWTLDAGRWTLDAGRFLASPVCSQAPRTFFCFKLQASSFWPQTQRAFFTFAPSLKLPASGPKLPTSTQRQPEVLTGLAFITFRQPHQRHFGVQLRQVTQPQAGLQVVSGFLQIIQA